MRTLGYITPLYYRTGIFNTIKARAVIERKRADACYAIGYYNAC